MQSESRCCLQHPIPIEVWVCYSYRRHVSSSW